MKPDSLRLMTCAVALAALAGSAAPVMAGPSAKTAAQMGASQLGVTNNAMPWTKVYSVNLKTSEQSEVLAAVSLECSLFTQTQVKGKKGDTTQATASASVKAKVMLDGRPMYPPYVTFCEREQTLTATLGGVLETCTFDLTVDGTGQTTASFNKNSCVFSDEMIDLALRTSAANHFNYIASNVGSGDHKIEVYLAVDQSASGEVLDDISGRTGYGSASAWATVGYGALVVEEVRLVQGSDGITQ